MSAMTVLRNRFMFNTNWVNANTMRLKMVFIMLASLMLVACNSSKNQSIIPEDKPNKKPKAENTFKLKQIWSSSIGGGFGSDFTGFKVEVANGIAYAASPSGDVRAIAVDGGKTAWKIDLKDKLSAGVGLGEGQVYIANDEGVVIALSMQDGKELWRYQASSEILTAPAASKKTVVIRSSDGKVIGLSAADGVKKWIIQRDLPRLSLRGDSQPLITQGVAVIGFASGNMLAIRLEDGAVIWDVPISTPRGSNEIERIIDVFSKPLLIRQTLFANTYQGNVVAIDIPTRRLEWRAQQSSYRDIVTDNDNLYLSDENGIIVALDAKSGSVIWSSDKLKFRNISAPSTVGSYLMVFGNDGDMYLFAMDDGTLFGSYKVSGKGIIGNPVINGNQFYILTSGGDLRAYELTQ